MTKPNIAIVGGGAAGFFAAITAKQTNPEAEVTIIEKAQNVLAKVAVTGGGRCNLTNTFEGITNLKQAYPRGHNLLKRLFKQFNEKDVFEWFEAHGVALTVQEDQCVFPVSQDAMSVVNCLTQNAHRLKVKILTGYRLNELKAAPQGGWTLSFQNGKSQTFDRVAITTGGSRPADLKYLQALGHNVEEPIPSLFTFNIDDRRLLALMGTVVNPAMTSIPSTKLKAQGPLLITHWGMSGPAILKLSSYGARYLYGHDYKVPVAVNWVNEANRSKVEEEVTGIAVRHPQKQLITIRPYNLTSRLWKYILQKTQLEVDKKWAEVGQKGINRLIETLTNDIYQVMGKGAYREEFVTCGGIALDNIDYNTLESKLCKGIYFAGEVLDMDGITGGFNLQAAWTTGYVVGRNIAQP